MSRHCSVFMFCFAAIAIGAGSSIAQVSRTGLVSEPSLRRFGLTRDWHTQVEVDSAQNEVTNAVLHVNSSRATTIFEIVYDGRKEQISQKQLDRFGHAIGVEGAQKLADQRVQQLKDRGRETELITRVIPEVTIYVTTSGGTVQAIDAETGNTRWMVTAGRSDHPTLAPAANDNYVALVNGSRLILLSARTGEFRWEQQLKHAPGAGPALTDDMVFVPAVSGHVESYRLGRLSAVRAATDSNDYQVSVGEVRESKFQPTQYFVSIGRALLQPTTTPAGNVCWATDRGYFYVANGDQMSLKYRLEANNEITAKASYSFPNQLFVSSIDGYVYSVKESTGDMLWRFSTGEPISQTAVPVGDDVYVATDDSNLFAVDKALGSTRWSKNGVRQFVAASESRVYCLSRTDTMLVLDRKLGGRIGALDAQGLNFVIVNNQTDRIYIGTDRGLLQCIHETQNDLPVLHIGDGSDFQTEPKIVKEGVDPRDAGGVKADDPFGKPAVDPKDPFGKPAVDPKDPFGAPKPAPAGDPFGGSSTPAPATDPFGGPAKDPFGGTP